MAMSKVYPKKKTTYVVKKKLTPEQKKEVKRMIESDIEHKCGFYNLSTGSVLSTGSIIGLATIITQGSTFTTRVGDQINLTSFQFKYKIWSDSTTFAALASTDPWNAVRVIIFRWRSDTAIGGNPTMADILNTGAADIITAVYNYDQKADYQILFDQTHAVTNMTVWNGSAAEVGPGPGTLFCSPYHRLYGKKLGKKKITYNANGTTNTDGIYLLVVSDSAFSPHPQLSFNASIEFTDA